MSTPTHVYGQSAREIRDANGWTSALVVETLNPQVGANGQTPETKRHIYITEGTYTGDFYLGARAFVEVEGMAGAVLVNDGLQIGKARQFTVRGLELRNCVVGIASHNTGGPVEVLYEDIYQHSFTNDRNGFANPHGRAAHPQTTTFRRVHLDSTGSPGNTRHQMYIEGRPGTKLIVEDSVLAGARGCSSVKTTCSQVEIRRTHFKTKSDLDPSITTGTMVDIPACSSAVIADCEFDMWRGELRAGLATPAIFFRLRRESLGSDIPAYPNEDWNPPVSTQTTASSPGYGWSAGPESYVDPALWAGVLEHWPLPQVSEYYAPFSAYISGNTFRVAADSKPIPWLRNDGTRAAQAVTQFSSTSIGLRMPPNWVERATVFHAGNTFEGAVLGAVLTEQAPYKPKPPTGNPPWSHADFLLTRTQPYHFPRAIEVPVGLPNWFRR